MKSRRGFTLMELAIVLGILGVLTVFALPQLGTFNETWTLDRFSDSVYNSLRSTGSQARGLQRDVRVTVDLDENRLRLQKCKCTDDTTDRCGSWSWNRGCTSWEDSDWESIQGLQPVQPPESGLFYAVGVGSYSSGSGDLSVRITPDGEAFRNYSHSEFAIHMTTEPAPDESDRCAFRTVHIRSLNFRVEEFDYGRGDPFPDDEPSCAS